MKRINRALLIFIMINAIAISLLGCGDKGKEIPSAVDAAVIYGALSNTPIPMIDDTLDELISDICNSCGKISIIVPDGKPFCFDVINISLPTKNYTTSTKERVLQRQKEAIKAALSRAKPCSTETDILHAIELAARDLSDSHAQKKLIYAKTSGLQSTGILNFTEIDYLSLTDTGELIAELKDRKAIPELDGIDVLISGLGDTCAPQDDLTPRQIDTLERIWVDLLTAAGARSVTLLTPLPSNDTPYGLPYVTPVTVASEKPISFMKLPASTLGFRPDSTDFLDYDLAEKTLSPIVEDLISHPDTIAVLAGTTATAGSQEKCRNFSYKRAEAVKNLMINLGVHEEQLVTKGLGYEHRFHLIDIDENGRLIPDAAEENRTVIICDMDSDDGEYIITF